MERTFGRTLYIDSYHQLILWQWWYLKDCTGRPASATSFFYLPITPQVVVAIDPQDMMAAQLQRASIEKEKRISNRRRTSCSYRS